MVQGILLIREARGHVLSPVHPALGSGPHPLANIIPLGHSIENPIHLPRGSQGQVLTINSLFRQLPRVRVRNVHLLIDLIPLQGIRKQIGNLIPLAQLRRIHLVRILNGLGVLLIEKPHSLAILAGINIRMGRNIYPLGNPVNTSATTGRKPVKLARGTKQSLRQTLH